MKLNPKMGFWRAKHGLSKHGLKKTKIGLQFGESSKNVWEKKKRRGRGRRRREEEEEETKQKGMELLTLSMELGFLVWIYEILRLCMGNGLSQKLGF